MRRCASSSRAASTTSLSPRWRMPPASPRRPSSTTSRRRKTCSSTRFPSGSVRSSMRSATASRGVTVVDALHRLQNKQCARLASPDFVHFARVIEDSQALQVKELEMMSGFAQAHHRRAHGRGDRRARRAHRGQLADRRAPAALPDRARTGARRPARAVGRAPVAGGRRPRVQAARERVEPVGACVASSPGTTDAATRNSSFRCRSPSSTIAT